MMAEGWIFPRRRAHRSVGELVRTRGPVANHEYRYRPLPSPASWYPRRRDPSQPYRIPYPDTLGAHGAGVQLQDIPIRAGGSQEQRLRLCALDDIDDPSAISDENNIEGKAHQRHGEGVLDGLGIDEKHAPTAG